MGKNIDRFGTDPDRFRALPDRMILIIPLPIFSHPSSTPSNIPTLLSSFEHFPLLHEQQFQVLLDSYARPLANCATAYVVTKQ